MSHIVTTEPKVQITRQRDCEENTENKAVIKAASDKDNPFHIQIGGSHYKDYAIQPAEFIHKNNLSFLQGCIIKRVMRYKDKAGLEDLEKAKHEINMLIYMEHSKHFKRTA